MTNTVRPSPTRPRLLAALLLASLVSVGGCSWLEIFTSVQEMRVAIAVSAEGPLPLGYSMEVETRGSQRTVPLVAGSQRVTLRVRDYGNADVILALRDAGGSIAATVPSEHTWTRGAAIFANVHVGLRDPNYGCGRTAKVALPPPATDSVFLWLAEKPPEQLEWCHPR